MPRLARPRDVLDSEGRIAPGEAYHRSHVLKWLRSHARSWNAPPPEDWPRRSNWRWTVDTADDLRMARAAFALFGERWPQIDYPIYGVVSPQPGAYASHPEYHNPPAYGAAKAGVIQFTRYAACHLAPHGIRVNCLSPGPFSRDKIRTKKGFAEELWRRVPLGRVGKPEKLVGPAAFLLSPASSFVTGHNLVVDGGWTAW